MIVVEDARYLADYSSKLASSIWSRCPAGIPTKAPLIRQALKGTGERLAALNWSQWPTSFEIRTQNM